MIIDGAESVSARSYCTCARNARTLSLSTRIVRCASARLSVVTDTLRALAADQMPVAAIAASIRRDDVFTKRVPTDTLRVLPAGLGGTRMSVQRPRGPRIGLAGLLNVVARCVRSSAP